MGNKVCIQHWKTKQMAFLSGHTNSVSSVAVSPLGTYIGSGQINHIGFKASAIRYMISLGGRDDGCVVLWDCVKGAATGTAAAARLTTGDAVTLCALTLRPICACGTSARRAKPWTWWTCRSASCAGVCAASPTGDMIKFSINYPSDPVASVAHCKPTLIGCLAKCGPWKKGKRPESQCYSQGRC
ncbi:hypothetical protein MSG28_004379 [Choristoneura fumiferana]|uniref:Uncharacterized protein n=1 Tax=Choristoneura fumiferana TaxID=7141 RepID=A0ACC0KJ71_CHOFU|nr:hypothetical protein MSG28_004379 [Choristoneura fumiferana]